MKKLIFTLPLLILLLGICSMANAQTVNKGAWIIGGDISYASISNSDPDVEFSTFSFSPSIGYFVIDNLAVGLGISYQALTFDGDTESSTGLAPMARYYVYNSVFAQIGYDLRFEDDEEDVLSIGAGYSWFVSNNVSIEPIVSYRIAGDDSAFGVSIGVQAFIGRN